MEYILRDIFLNHVVTCITFVPLIGVAALLLIPSRHHNVLRWVALVATLPQLLIGAGLYIDFDCAKEGMQFVERATWIESFDIQYYVGIDGLSLPMVLLTALLCPICIVASWGINKAVKGYMILFLLLDVGMMGVFIALDFFLFYVFWEVMLLPMYFLIGIWGGPRKEYAAIKFFLYTLLGSLLMLLAILWLYWQYQTFDMVKLMKVIGTDAPVTTMHLLVWLAFFICFAIKVPIFPFHTWLPDAHVEAPTAISVILAGVLLKMGTYGILRVNYPVLPNATKYFNGDTFFSITESGFALLALLGVINIVYGALCAMAQTDMKRLVAYSSISHMGFVLLGISSYNVQGMTGGVLQMFNHGIVTAMLFLLVGVVYDRVHHRDLTRFGGLAMKVPVYSAICGLAFFAALGLPGLNSFISEILVLLGAFKTYPIATAIAASGIILTAAYCLWTLQRIFLGPFNENYKDLADINTREIITLAPLGVLVITLGVYPMPVLNILKTAMNGLITVIGG